MNCSTRPPRKVAPRACTSGADKNEGENGGKLGLMVGKMVGKMVENGGHGGNSRKMVENAGSMMVSDDENGENDAGKWWLYNDNSLMVEFMASG